jgi:ribokinase
MFGDQAIAGFVADGIHVEHILRDSEAPSGVALIFVARDGENSIAVAGGANARLSPIDVLAAQPALEGADTLLMQLETPLETVQTAAELAASRGVRTILNPAPAQPLPDPLLRLVSILTPNETEAELLTGIPITDEASIAFAAGALRHRGVATVVVTLGGRGAFVSTADIEHLVPGFPVTPVDTTAAGDIFNGALAVALGEGCPLLEAVRFANAAAALSVTKLGAQPSAPARAEIDRILG